MRGDDGDKPGKKGPSTTDQPDDVDDDGDDDEAVRCICGFEDYPGQPQIDVDNKHGIKDGIEPTDVPAAEVTDDSGFFLQCDACKVWQHGGCVGIMNETASPEEYYCEQCRKDLHRLAIAINGYVLTLSIGSQTRRFNFEAHVDSQQYSLYLPLHPSISRTHSRAPSHPKEGQRSPRTSKSGQSATSIQNAKRRSTMNSRESAYNEEEQLRLAIEASKGDKPESINSSIRKGKRGRSESLECVSDLEMFNTMLMAAGTPKLISDNAQHLHLHHSSHRLLSTRRMKMWNRTRS